MDMFTANGHIKKPKWKYWFFEDFILIVYPTQSVEGLKYNNYQIS